MLLRQILFHKMGSDIGDAKGSVLLERNVIGLDIGTTGVKGVLVSEHGTILCSVAAEYPIMLSRPGWAEQEPEDWVRASFGVIRDLLKNGKVNGDTIAGLALSGQMHGLVCLDSNNCVLRSAILWCDTRTSAQCRYIEECLGGKSEVLRSTGNSALEGFTLPKLLWVKEHQPDIYAETKTILLPKDYVRFRLTGQLGMDLSDAAGTMLLDIETLEWSSEVAEKVGVEVSLLPRLGGSADVAGYISGPALKETGLSKAVPVAYGGADNACAAVGTGVLASGDMAISIGSSGTVIAPVNKPMRDTEGRLHTFVHAVPGMWYVMGVMQAAGLSMKWFKDNFGECLKQQGSDNPANPYDLLIDGAADVPAGCEGMLWLPYLNGERTPHLDPLARGVLFGITARHSRAHVMRAVMEGVAFGINDLLQLIKELGIEPSEVRITGGGGKSELWRRIVSDVIDCSLDKVTNEEGPALGAAMIAGVAAGVFSSFNVAATLLVKVGSRTQPDAQAVKAYERVYDRYKRLYNALKPEFEIIS